MGAQGCGPMSEPAAGAWARGESVLAVLVPARRHHGAMGGSLIRRTAPADRRGAWPLCAIPLDAPSVNATYGEVPAGRKPRFLTSEPRYSSMGRHQSQES